LDIKQMVDEHQCSDCCFSTAMIGGTAQHSTAQHSTAQHSTAQHSTAQHSTAQHSAAQHSTIIIVKGQLVQISKSYSHMCSTIWQFMFMKC